MISKWYEYKEIAIKLRKKGYSIRHVESKLKIPRSTLSGWFKDIVLTKSQEKRLKNGAKKSLIKARKSAVVWHNKQKQTRIAQSQSEALEVLKNIDEKNINILEVALSLLYIGEGYKNNRFGIGSSDPNILKFFLQAILNIYKIERSNIRCDLNLRADQKSKLIIKFWSKELNIPKENFKTVSFDKRTIGSKTYPSYKGVCQLNLGHVSIQRRLLFLAKLYCDKVINH